MIRYNGVDYYYHRNAQGDIDGISNAAGELVASYRYDAWGKPISITGSMASTIGVLNPFRYRGYVYDEETGLYYLNTRYYDPEVGRFISPDSVSYLGADGTILGYDLYTYCDNDPVNNKDSEGSFSSAIIGGLIGGLIGGVSSALIGDSFWAGAIQGATSGFIAGAFVDVAVWTCGAGIIGAGVAMKLAGAGGLVGSVAGDVVYSHITGTKMEWGKSIVKGVVAGTLNLMSFGCAGGGARFTESVSFTKFLFSFGVEDCLGVTVSETLGIVDTYINNYIDTTVENTNKIRLFSQMYRGSSPFHKRGISGVVMMCE